MDANRKRVLGLAEQSDWDEVLLLVALNPTLPRPRTTSACCRCTGLVKTLTRAFPGACNLENLSGMLPLHVAIKAKAPGLLVSALLHVYLQAALAKDGNGRCPVDLAIANGLPSFTIDFIRETGSQALQSASKLQMLSIDGLTNVGSNNSNQSEEDVPVSKKPRSMMSSCQQSLDRKPSAVSSAADPVDSSTISLQLKNLLSQLHQLSVDIRVNNTSSSSLTYCSSFSSASTTSANGLVSVLWNPSDRFGIVLEPAVKDTGARIKGFSSRSDVLGVESLAVGDTSTACRS